MRLTDALLDRAAVFVRAFYADDDIDMPAGYIGSGASRSVYRIDDWVIKLEEFPYANEDEFTNYLALKNISLPDNVVLPYTELHYIDDWPVILMEYVEGEPMDGDDPMYYRFARIGLLDSDFENVIIKDGLYYLIDLDTCSLDSLAPA